MQQLKEPNAIEIEKSLLGQLIIDSNCFINIIDIIKEEMFFNDNNKIIFSSLLKMHEEKRSIDTLTIIDYLRKISKIEEAGGVSYVCNLSKNIFSGQNIREYALILLEKYLQRKLINFNYIQSKRINTDYEFNLIDEIDIINEELKGINNIITGISNKKLSITELLLLSLEKYYIKKTNKIKNEYEINIKDIDRNLMIERGDLVLIGARPAIGKTSFALQIAREYSKNNKKGLFFSLEMTKDKLINRILIAETGIDNTRFRYGSLYNEEEEKLNKKVREIESWNLIIEDKPALSLLQIEAMATIEQPDYIIIDYLGLVKLAEKDTRNNELGGVSRGLKSLAKKLNIPIIALHQLSRAVESRGNKRPMLSDLRDSGELEQDADIILFIYRDAYYTKNYDNKEVEIDIAKYREGASGFVRLEHDYQISNFKSTNNIF